MSIIQFSMFSVQCSTPLTPALSLRERECADFPSTVGRALNKDRIIQHILGPLVPRRVLKNYRSLSARDGQRWQLSMFSFQRVGRNQTNRKSQICIPKFTRRVVGIPLRRDSRSTTSEQSGSHRRLQQNLDRDESMSV